MTQPNSLYKNKFMVIGIDIGGTNIRASLVQGGKIQQQLSEPLIAGKASEEVLQQLFTIIDRLINSSVKGIGIGVPGVVEDGILYDAVNIPSWKEISLQLLLQERYSLETVVENDANCFALGELHYGKGKEYESLIGVTIGTGLGCGIIINKRLYKGHNGGAGEFGMLDYREHCLEYYASGQFFQNEHGMNGELAFDLARQGQANAISMYREFGIHLGNAIKSMLYTFDVPLIILGGAVSQAYKYFYENMWNSVNEFAYKRTLKNLSIELSELQNGGVLGAAALVTDV
jgi:glucokinase